MQGEPITVLGRDPFGLTEDLVTLPESIEKDKIVEWATNEARKNQENGWEPVAVIVGVLNILWGEGE